MSHSSIQSAVHTDEAKWADLSKTRRSQNIRKREEVRIWFNWGCEITWNFAPQQWSLRLKITSLMEFNVHLSR